MTRTTLLALFLSLMLLAPAGAQPAATAPGNAPAEGGVPPYEADMLKLSEILGALHYIRPLCGAAEGTRWRDEMQGLLEAEAPSDARRGQIIAAFNRGYQSYAEVYRTCTASADLASQRYLETGAKLSRDIAARYGSN
ncbi:MAG TPA: TIGR02301 family protein [Ancylobacter sp.]